MDWLKSVAEKSKAPIQREMKKVSKLPTPNKGINITEIVEALRGEWKAQLDEAEYLAHYYRGKLEGVDELLSKIAVPGSVQGSGQEGNQT